MKKILAAVLAVSLICPTCCAASVPNPPSISASSAILMDAESGRVLYEKDAHSRRLIASTTKLMTALVAVESTPRLDKVITVKPEYQAEGSSMYLKVGEELTLKELLYGMLLQSGNDAALTVAGGCAGTVETFVKWMNQWAEDIGMSNSHFVNPNGLDDEAHYSTAYDMALLGREVLKNEVLREIMSTRSITVAGRSLTNHNKLLWQYEGCEGMKTGYTMAAGRTLVSCATRNGQTLICVTLHDPDDWDDHKALLDYGFENWPAHPLTRMGKTFRMVPVVGSLLPWVPVVVESELVYPLTAKERVRVKVSLPEQAEAPIRKGTVAGKLTFMVGEEMVGETYLLYGTDVPANRPDPTLFQRIRGLLIGTTREESKANWIK